MLRADDIEHNSPWRKCSLPWGRATLTGWIPAQPRLVRLAPAVLGRVRSECVPVSAAAGVVIQMHSQMALAAWLLYLVGFPLHYQYIHT